jgi:multiple sugar transport system permease protein
MRGWSAAAWRPEPMRRVSFRLRVALWAANLAAIGFLILPLVPVVIGSIQSEKSFQADTRALLPREPILANFQLILSGGARKGPIFEQVSYLPKSVERFPTAFLNSVLVALSVTVLTLAAGSLSAYTVARFELRWVKALLSVSLAARLVPLIVLMVPLYVMFRRYGLLNSVTGVVVAEVGFLMPYAVLILAPYFASLPSELEDAARIDGCSRFGAFLRIVLPLSRPGLAACGTIMFIISWHELLIPLIVVSQPEAMTLPVVIAGLVSDYFVFFTLMMAICLLGLAPTVVLVLLLQKYVVRGLVAGALKG